MLSELELLKEKGLKTIGVCSSESRGHETVLCQWVGRQDAGKLGKLNITGRQLFCPGMH